jgi:hypothetical protein
VQLHLNEQLRKLQPDNVFTPLHTVTPSASAKSTPSNEFRHGGAIGEESRKEHVHQTSLASSKSISTNDAQCSHFVVGHCPVCLAEKEAAPEVGEASSMDAPIIKVGDGQKPAAAEQQPLDSLCSLPCLPEKSEVACPLVDMVLLWGQETGSHVSPLLKDFAGKVPSDNGKDRKEKFGKAKFTATERVEIYQVLAARCFATAAFCWLNPQTFDGAELEELLANKFCVETEERQTGILDSFKQIALLLYGRLQLVQKEGEHNVEERARLGKSLMEWIYCAKRAIQNNEDEFCESSSAVDSEAWLLTFLEGKLWGKFRNSARQLFSHVSLPSDVTLQVGTFVLEDEELMVFNRALGCYWTSFTTCGGEKEGKGLTNQDTTVSSMLESTSKLNTYHRLHATRLKLLYLAGDQLSHTRLFVSREHLDHLESQAIIRALWCLYIVQKHGTTMDDNISSVIDFMGSFHYLITEKDDPARGDFGSSLSALFSKMWDVYILCYVDCLVAMQECIDADQHCHQAVYTLSDALHKGQLPQEYDGNFQPYLGVMKDKYSTPLAARAQKLWIDEGCAFFGVEPAKRCLHRLFSRRVVTVVAIWMPQSTLEKWESLQQRQSKYDHFRRKYLLKYLQLLDATADWERLLVLHKQLDGQAYRQAATFNSEMQWYLFIAMASVLQTIVTERRCILDTEVDLGPVSPGTVQRRRILNAERCLQWAYQLHKEISASFFGKKYRQNGVTYPDQLWVKDANNRNVVSFLSLCSATETLLVESFSSYDALRANDQLGKDTAPNVSEDVTSNPVNSCTAGTSMAGTINAEGLHTLDAATRFCASRWRGVGGRGRIMKAHQKLSDKDDAKSKEILKRSLGQMQHHASSPSFDLKSPTKPQQVVNISTEGPTPTPTPPTAL